MTCFDQASSSGAAAEQIGSYRIHTKVTWCVVFSCLVLLPWLAIAQSLTVSNGSMELPVVGAWSTTKPPGWTWNPGSGVGDVGLTSTSGANGTQQSLYGNQLAGTFTSAATPETIPGEGSVILKYWAKRENFGNFTLAAETLVGGVSMATRTDVLQSNVWTQYTVNCPVTAADAGKTAQVRFTFSGSGAWQGYLDEISLAFSNTAPQVSFGAADIIQSETNSLCTVAVYLSRASSAPVAVNYYLAGGTAIAGTHYNFTPGTLNFAPGVLSNGFSFSILDNPTYQVTKTVLFNLTSSSNTVLGNYPIQTVLIVDPEDRPPARNFYVDSVAGSDANSGTDIAAPWKSLAKLNATTFRTGDSILLKAGSTWTGQLHPLGSGDYNGQITIDMYGSGAKPRIDGGGISGGTFYLLNQQYWTINNLELSNLGSTNIAKKQGILIKNDCVGTLNRIYVRNCYIHDVNGVMDNYIDGKESGGIVFYVTSSNTNVPSKWNDIRIENNVIRDVVREGILLQSLWVNKPQDPNTYWSSCGPYYPSTQVRIASNILERIGGDGIIPWAVNGAVVEYNYVRQSNLNNVGQGHAAVWPYICENIVFQFNEICETQTRFDGMALDLDHSNQNCIYQYNYSHDNQGGFLNMCSAGNANNNIVRYNISENDGCVAGGRVFLIYGAGNHNYSVYNNTVFVHSNNPPVFQDDGGGSASSTINFYNNIIINLGSGSMNTPAGCFFDRNLFFGNGAIASDANKLQVNPLLIAAGSGSNGLASVAGYKLATNSPALRTGRIIPDNGGRDYWQNPVPAGVAPNLGAYNGMGVPEITNLLWSVSGTNLVLNWPLYHVLRTQTNLLPADAGSNAWPIVPGSTTTNRMVVPIERSVPARFFRATQP